MSPEQLLSARQVDARADIWALGIILYRLLTGVHPFIGETAPAVHVAIASALAPKLREKRPDAPIELEQLVERCLVKSRDGRLGSVAEFLAVLLPFASPETKERYAHLLQSAAPPLLPSAPSLPQQRASGQGPFVPEGETRSTWGGNRNERSHRASFAALALALIAATGGSIYLVGRSSRVPEITASPHVLPATAAADPLKDASVVAPIPATPISPTSSVASTSLPRTSPPVPISRPRARPSAAPISDPYGQRR